MGKLGRKSVYETKIKARFDDIEKWMKKGATERSIAGNLGIAYSTFSKYKLEKSELTELLKKSREPAVEDIENAMFSAAIGGIQKIKKCAKCKRIEYENGRRVREEEIMVPYEEEMYIPPNTTAGIYLLKHWGKDKGYTNDPLTLELKTKELELKEKIAEENSW